MRKKRPPRPLGFSISSPPEADQPQVEAGRFVRGLTSRAESNEERDLPALLAHRLLGWNSICSPRPASKLAHETNTGSDSRYCYLRLAESSNATEPMFAYEGREVPEMKRVVVAPRGRG